MRCSPCRPVTVCVIGGYERDYPRNATVRRMLAELGYQVVECHSDAPFPSRYRRLASSLWRVRNRIDVVWVAEGGHQLVPWIRAVTPRRVPVIFDPFLSRWSTRVEDRRLFEPHTPRAWLAAWHDFSSCWAADHLVFDTYEHRRYFYDRYRLRKPWSVLQVGIDEDVFDPEGPAEDRSTGGCDVLFYGTYIPLHGIDVILHAAAGLSDRRDVRFTLVGEGQTRVAMESVARSLGDLQVVFLPSQPAPLLARRIRSADVCLGIFGATTKAGNVVPNKVVQCTAMGKAIVTRRSAAIERDFVDGRDLLLVPAGDPTALAGAIEVLAADPERRARLGRAARAAYERSFGADVLRSRLQQLLLDAGAPLPGPQPDVDRLSFDVT